MFKEEYQTNNEAEVVEARKDSGLDLNIPSSLSGSSFTKNT
jgi:hypothetical protein